MRPTKTPPPPSAGRTDAHGRELPLASGQVAWLRPPGASRSYLFRIRSSRDRRGLYRVAAGAHVESHQSRPPLRRQQRFEHLGIGIDEDEPEHVTGIGAGVEPDE